MFATTATMNFFAANQASSAHRITGVVVTTLACCVLCLPLVFYLGLPSTGIGGAWIATAIVATAVLAILLLANRRHQFGVRAFLLAVAVLSAVLATLSISIENSRNERSSIMAIAALGGRCVNAYGLDPELVWVRTPMMDRGITTVQGVKLANSKAQDADLALLQSFSDLTALDVTNTTVSDEGLRHLMGHTRLEQIAIGGSRVTIDGVIKLFLSQGRTLAEALSAVGFAVELNEQGDFIELGYRNWEAICNVVSRPEVAGVETLDLALSEVTDRELARLAHLKNLRFLETASTAVTFAGVKRLIVELQGRDIREAMRAYGWTTRPGQSLTHTLFCDQDRVKDADLVEIGQFLSLEVLLLNSTHITDAGIKHLDKLSRLRSLHLHTPHVTDDGLRQLAGLAHLEDLDLGSSLQITSNALLHLPNRENLKSLNLFDNAIDGKGLRHLHTMTGLRVLTLPDYMGSAADFAALRDALPNTAITIYNTGQYFK
jgi:hypothetical protein